MEIKKLSLAGIDYESGKKRFGGNGELYEKFLRRFPEETTYGELLRALESHDRETAFHCAHTLKGIAGNLSFDYLCDLMQELTNLLRSGSDEDISPALMEKIQTSYDAVVAALK